MRTFLLTATVLAGTISQVAAMPVPVDLSTWQSDALGSANWVLQNAPANDGVLQTRNGEPTVFFDASANAQGTALSGQITVQTAGDDDFIGFVLGYQDNELTSTMADFVLVDWKQADQTFTGRSGPEGLAISYVSGDRSSASNLDFWGHENTVTEIARGTTLGSTGWNDNQTYTFDLVFTSGLIQVSVDGNLELSITPGDAGISSFTDGSFGFYNYSQDNVLYGSIGEQVVPDPDPDPDPPVTVSEPGMLGLLGFALATLGIVRRRG